MEKNNALSNLRPDRYIRVTDIDLEKVAGKEFSILQLIGVNTCEIGDRVFLQSMSPTRRCNSCIVIKRYVVGMQCLGVLIDDDAVWEISFSSFAPKSEKFLKFF